MVTPLPETLAALARTRYGPVTFEEGDGGLTARFDGTSALVAPDGGPLLVMASASCADAPDPDVAARIRAALAELAAGRPDLCTLTVSAAEHAAVARWWVPQDAGSAELAAAVRSAILLARVGTAVVDAVLRDAETAATYRRAQSEASRAADEAERALHRLLSAEPGSPPSPAVPTPAAPARDAPTPAACVADQAAQVLGGGSDHTPVGMLRPGATYQVLGTAQGWLHVRGEGLEGWAPASAVHVVG